MPDSYQLPALVLTVLLLPAFFQLYLRFRETRTLLWLLGFLFACVRMLQVYQLGLWDYSDTAVHPWIASIGQASHLISSGLFLASSRPSRSVSAAAAFSTPFLSSFPSFFTPSFSTASTTARRPKHTPF